MPKSTDGSRLVYRKFDEEEIIDIFSSHPPTQGQAEIYQAINEACIECVKTIAPLLPDGPGKMAAIRKLADARMACRAAVALAGKF